MMQLVLDQIKEYNSKNTIKIISDKNLYNKILIPLQNSDAIITRLKNIKYNYSINSYKHILKRFVIRQFYYNREFVDFSNESNQSKGYSNFNNIFTRVLDLNGKFYEIIEEFMKEKELKDIKLYTNTLQSNKIYAEIDKIL